MPLIRLTDPDFCVCQASFVDLLEMQSQAETNGWATRWSSEEALRGQVKEATAYLQPMLREERKGETLSYRCLVLFSAASGDAAGGVATIDITPEMLTSLERIDRDAQARKALKRIFSLASGGISMLSKD